MRIGRLPWTVRCTPEIGEDYWSVNPSTWISAYWSIPASLIGIEGTVRIGDVGGYSQIFPEMSELYAGVTIETTWSGTTVNETIQYLGSGMYRRSVGTRTWSHTESINFPRKLLRAIQGTSGRQLISPGTYDRRIVGGSRGSYSIPTNESGCLMLHDTAYGVSLDVGGEVSYCASLGDGKECQPRLILFGPETSSRDVVVGTNYGESYTGTSPTGPWTFESSFSGDENDSLGFTSQQIYWRINNSIVWDGVSPVNARGHPTVPSSYGAVTIDVNARDQRGELLSWSQDVYNGNISGTLVRSGSLTLY